MRYRIIRWATPDGPPIVLSEGEGSLQRALNDADAWQWAYNGRGTVEVEEVKARLLPFRARVTDKN
jgi:hypothetical protein